MLVITIFLQFNTCNQAEFNAITLNEVNGNNGIFFHKTYYSKSGKFSSTVNNMYR